jgi:hypothetical protein
MPEPRNRRGAWIHVVVFKDEAYRRLRNPHGSELAAIHGNEESVAYAGVLNEVNNTKAKKKKRSDLLNGVGNEIPTRCEPGRG